MRKLTGNLYIIVMLMLSLFVACSEEPAVGGGGGGGEVMPQGTVYVSTAGADGNDGTIDSPVASLSNALEIVLAENLAEMKIASGHYVVGGPLIITNDQLEISGNYDESFSSNTGETVLDGNQIYEIFIISNSSGISIKNLTISNADGYDGGGIIIANSIKQSMSNLLFIKNEGGIGGAMTLYDSRTEIADCDFIENTAVASGGEAGAIHLDDGTLSIKNCEFIGNTANGWGGAIFSENYATLSIDACHFELNYADYPGGAIRIFLGDITISNSVFITNGSGGSYGGALSVLDSSASIISNHFTENYISNDGSAFTISANNQGIFVSNNMIGPFNHGYCAVRIDGTDQNDMYFLDNMVIMNHGVGIQINSGSPTFADNIISRNWDHGMELINAGPFFNNDSIMHHTNYGIYVISGSVPDTSTVNFSHNDLGDVGP